MDMLQEIESLKQETSISIHRIGKNLSIITSMYSKIISEYEKQITELRAKASENNPVPMTKKK